MKTKKIISFIALLVVLLFLVTETERTTTCVKEALNLCVNAVVPSLFPFFVISGLLVKLGFVTVLGKAFMPVSRLFFNQSGKGAVVFLIGIVCGYPTGAKVISDMYKEKAFSRDDAERLLAFCNNSGPLFVIGAVGTNMLSNHSLGAVLYIIHLLSAVFVGIVFRKKKKIEKEKSEFDIGAKSISQAISESVEGAVKSTLNVCGYVVFFSILCVMAKNVFLVSLLEVTTGAKNLIAYGFGEKLTFVLLSGVIGFGGICVLFQVQSAVCDTGLSLKFYILGKVMQGVISMALALLYVNLFEIKPAFATLPSPEDSANIVAILFLISTVFSYFRLTKNG